MFRVNNKTRLAASVWASFFMVFYQAAYYQTLGLHDMLLIAFFCHLITVQQLFFSKERCFSCLFPLKTAGLTGCEIIIFFFMTVWSRSYDLEFVTVCTERCCFQMTSGYVLRFGPIKSQMLPAAPLNCKQSSLLCASTAEGEVYAFQRL